MFKLEDNNEGTISLSESTHEVENAPKEKKTELIFTALDKAIKEQKLGQIVKKADEKYTSNEPSEIKTEQISLSETKVTSSLIDFLMKPPFLLTNKIFIKFEIEILTEEEKENLKSSIVKLILENWDSKIIQWLIKYLSFGDATNNFIIALIEIIFPRILKINLKGDENDENKKENNNEQQ
ncbi:hypothetical protein ES702_06195 [subsurface metagenome]